MGKRERIEDLGRISERLHALLTKHDDLFDIREEHWEDLSVNPDWIETFCLTMQQIGRELDDIWCIARFGDDEDDVEGIYRKLPDGCKFEKDL